MNARICGWHRVGWLEHNPTSLQTRSRQRVAIVSEYVPSMFGGYSTYCGVILSSECPQCAVSSLPWETGTPTFDPARDVRIGSWRHIIDDHLDRFAGATSPQVRARFKRALEESLALVQTRAGEVASYWYQRGGHACYVIPLRLGGEWEPVAAVLNRMGDHYVVVTILPRHEAFWNVATTGYVPPDWLDETPTRFPGVA